MVYGESSEIRPYESEIEKIGVLAPILTHHNVGDKVDGSALYHAWHLLVNEYTFRSLKMGEDKLPALAGLAAEFYRHVGSKYLAGILRSREARKKL